MGSSWPKLIASTNTTPVPAGEAEERGNDGTHSDIAPRMRTVQRFPWITPKQQLTNEGRIKAWALAVEAREQYKVGHHQRVAKLAYAIACEMGRLPNFGHTLCTAALVHDVGKIFVPMEVLTRPGPLTRYEFATITAHPRVGHQILHESGCAWPVADIVLQHHERMDGSGYPSGLKGVEIRQEARILGLADTVEAMLHPRPYRPALGIENALEKVATDKGMLYDRDVVEACLSVFIHGGFKFRSE